MVVQLLSVSAIAYSILHTWPELEEFDSDPISQTDLSRFPISPYFSFRCLLIP